MIAQFALEKKANWKKANWKKANWKKANWKKANRAAPVARHTNTAAVQFIFRKYIIFSNKLNWQYQVDMSTEANFHVGIGIDFPG